MTKLPLSHTVPYFKTSQSSPAAWIAKSIALLKKLEATEIGEGFVSAGGIATFAISFKINDERFRIAWPVLPTKDPGDETAARIQAATFVFHEVKARSLAAAVLGARSSFVSYLLLPNGSSVMESSNAAIESHVKPMKMLT